MTETRDVMIRRMKMRSMRRGIKEMDLILGGFGARGLAELPPEDLALYDQFLEENDHDLYAWCSGATERPEKYIVLIEKIMVNSDLTKKVRDF